MGYTKLQTNGIWAVGNKQIDNSWENIIRVDGNISAPQGLVDQLQAETEAKLQATYTQAMESLMDSKAKEKGYDTRYTASARAGVIGSPFQAEGQAFALWMDNCYAQGYTILADVKAGTLPLPTVDEFLLMLPELVW